jgi:hypothetical protein
MSRKSVAESFIHCQERANGRKYAKFCPADRKHGGRDKYLGIVINEANGIFYNRKSGGFFRFTVDGGKQELAAGERAYYEVVRKGCGRDSLRKVLALDFGDAWFLDYILENSGLKQLFAQTCLEDADTLLALISFRLLETDAHCYAQRWLEGSYARYLYPQASISSQRVSEFLARLGAEEAKRAFFDAYIPYMKGLLDLSENVLIDSTGLPNDIHFEYTRVNNHNGAISRETRLIYVAERGTGLPVYFRYVAGNIVDVSTLRTTINQLKAQGVSVSHGILDAGYCSKKNFEALKAHGIPFLTRLPGNAVAKGLIERHGGDLLSKKHTLKYGDRLICMKRVGAQVYGQDCHAYIALDVGVMQDEQKRYLEKSAKAAKKGKGMADEAMKRLGCFVMVSSEALEASEVLPLYYMRQSIEQTFDLAKNDVDLVPLRTHTVETFRGHLLLCFMATVALITVRRYLATRKKLKDLCAKMVLKDMRFIKCDVFGQTLVMTEPSKNANLIINELKLALPDVLNL